jgi:hypothetical protein
LKGKGVRGGRGGGGAGGGGGTGGRKGKGERENLWKLRRWEGAETAAAETGPLGF